MDNPCHDTKIDAGNNELKQVMKNENNGYSEFLK